mmetsp:Transcript_167637/g.538407  ORF Transcript_167637/g.538407 Transcript_167637/m.538407 type:complete len:205 (+) Transcript_167637:768-1382(+)
MAHLRPLRRRVLPRVAGRGRVGGGGGVRCTGRAAPALAPPQQQARREGRGREGGEGQVRVPRLRLGPRGRRRLGLAAPRRRRLRHAGLLHPAVVTSCRACNATPRPAAGRMHDGDFSNFKSCLVASRVATSVAHLGAVATATDMPCLDVARFVPRVIRKRATCLVRTLKAKPVSRRVCGHPFQQPFDERGAHRALGHVERLQCS